MLDKNSVRQTNPIAKSTRYIDKQMNRQISHLAFERLEDRRLLAGDPSPWETDHIAVAGDEIPVAASQALVDSIVQSPRPSDDSTNLSSLAFPDSNSAAPLLWMQDNSLGRQGGLPSDFLQRFNEPEGWEHSLRAIDTLSLNEHAMTASNGITNEVLSDVIVPVLNRDQVNVSLNSVAANFLNHRSRATGQTFEELLEDHFALLDRMVDAGIRVRTISVNGPLNRVPADLAGRNQYPISDRIDDVVKYAELVRARYPFIDVGIQDNLIDFGEDYQSIYGQLQDAMQSSGGELDHIHYYRLVDLIGSDRAIDWPDVIEMQNFVQGDLGSEFGLIVSSSGALESADQWRHDVIFNGIRPYLDLLGSSEGQTSRTPDRFIIAAWANYPEASYPEDRVNVDGTWQRLSTSTGTVRQASNLIRGYGDTRADALVDEIQQVQPIDASGIFDTDDQAWNAVSGRSLVDGNELIDEFQWLPPVNDTSVNPNQYWLTAELPDSVNIDRIRFWPAINGDTRTRQAFIRVFASDTGEGSPFGSSEHWDQVGEMQFDGRTADSFTMPVDVHRKKFIGVRLFYIDANGPHVARGLGAIRFYSPNNNWNGSSDESKPNDPLPDSDRPVLNWQTREVNWFDPGATIGKAIADGFDAAGQYQLSVDDDRFDFFLSFLTLKNGILIDDGEAPTVTVNVTLTDRDDPRRVFSYPFTFDVTSPLDQNGNPKDVFDYGDSSFYDRGTPLDSVARHRLGELFLGDRVDSELAPQNDHLSRGDDMDTDGDDDDGVVFVGNVTAFETQFGSGTIRVQASHGGRLDGWIDFNNNQVFDHPEEHLFGGQSVDVSDGYQLLDFSVPESAVVDERTFARFRISFDGGLRPYDDQPRTSDTVGEVEDYELRIRSGSVTTPQPPSITWQNFPVVSGVQGATAAKILADGYDASGRYDLSVDDPRFEFERSFLRLQSDQRIWQHEEQTVTVQITLIDKADSTRVFHQDIIVPIRDQSTELFDYGDAPYRFGTTQFEDGPRHRLSELSLGRRVDAEADGQNQFQALGDDIDASGDDEDGVVLVSDLTSLGTVGVGTIVVDSSDNALLDAWIDFNGNGRFDHPEEHLGQNRGGQSIAVTVGMNVIDFVVPASLEPGSTYARYRLSSTGGLTPYGIADDGEVEDYRYQVKTALADGDVTFSWPNVSLPNPSAMDVIVSTDSQGIVIEDPLRTLATFEAEQVSISGSDGNDRVRLSNSELITSGSAKLQLGEGEDELSFQSLVQIDLQDFPSESLSGITRLNLRGQPGDSISISPESLADVTASFDPIEVLVDADDLVTFSDRWDDSQLIVVDGLIMHQITGLGTTIHLVNDRFWTHAITPSDVNSDGETSALDALLIINRLSRINGEGFLPIREPENLTEDFFDVSGDNRISALDALRVINLLSRQSNPTVTPEGEFPQIETLPPNLDLQLGSHDEPVLHTPYEQLQSQSLAESKSSRGVSVSGDSIGNRHSLSAIDMVNEVTGEVEIAKVRELAMLDDVIAELASEIDATSFQSR